MNFERVDCSKFSLLIFPIYLFASTSVHSAWEIEPSVEASIGYSDNIELDGDDEESGFVSQVNPGISVAKTDGRFRVQLDYLMQNFYYFDGSQLDTNHILDSIARLSVIPERFYINAFAQAEQVLIDNDQQISVDNFNDTGNTTDEYFYGIGPQWTQDLFGYALADVAYIYSENRFDEETAGDGDEGDLDDNDRQNFLAKLGNKNKQADRFDWTASYEWDDIDFEVGEDFEFITQQLELGYQLSQKLSLVGSYGYEDNDLGTNNAFDDDDGTFWTAGVLVGLGEFSFLEVRRGERFFGNFWLGEVSIAGPKLGLSASYEETVDVSGTDDIEFGFTEDEAEDLFDVVENDISLSPDDNNSVSRSKIWSVAVSYETGKSLFLAEVANEDEEFLDSTDTEQLETYTLAWIWNITGISSLSIIGEYEKDESVDTVSGEVESDFIDIEIAYEKSLSPKTDAILSYSYSEGDSDTFVDGKFTSNTVIAGIEHKF